MGAQAKTTTDKTAARREQATALHESITAKVAQLTDTDAWAAYLTAAAAFPDCKAKTPPPSTPASRTS